MIIDIFEMQDIMDRIFNAYCDHLDQERGAHERR